MIVVKFEDFRKLALENNKRLYYYRADNILVLYFITEGIFTKSFVNLNTIENTEVFFGEPLFHGATELLFNISRERDQKSVENVGLGSRDAIVEDNRHAEEENKDLQKEGVD